MLIKIYLISELVYDVVVFSFLVCFLFCWYCDPLGLLFPLRAEYILNINKYFLRVNL